ncbi:hypothetical protein BKA61DRAFT_480978 [Leptodontidium sp. MPI-SDFR-AT-0119]|nr:hypothetical protein BKA61DRAFT_480978 [Leptodontidium sp. MPI-SDFR-AT-0119]
MLGGLSDFAFAQVLDEHSVILIPREYIRDDPEQLLRREPSALCCFRTCIAYELLGKDHPNIARYISRDAWTGFPILARPTGPPLEVFLDKHRSKMFSSSSSDVNTTYLPLVLNWALQALSGLAFIHSHENFYYKDLSIYNCWLSSDLFLSLIGFLNADFRDQQGCLHAGFGSFRGPTLRLTRIKPHASVKSDLFDWATFVYTLMTNKEPERDPFNAYLDVPKQIRAKDYPQLSEHVMGKIVRKCWLQEYQNAMDVRRDVAAFLLDSGFEVDGDGIRGFVPANIPDIST